MRVGPRCLLAFFLSGFLPGAAAFVPEAGTQGLQPEAEPNGTAASATMLASTNTVALGNIFPTADVDFWSFTGAAGDRVYAAVQTAFNAEGGTDSTLSLLASDGVTVLETDLDDGTFGALSSSIAGAALPANGTYYLRVSASTQLRPYHLHVRLQPLGTATVEVEPNDGAGNPQPLPASGWISGTHSVSTDQDWYSFNANAGDTVFASLDLDPERDALEWPGRLGLGLFGGFGLTLATDDAGSPGPDSEAFFLTVKTAGTYLVRVDSIGGGTGTYHLSVSIHPATAIGTSCQTYGSGLVELPIADGGATDAVVVVPGHPRIEDVSVSLSLTHTSMPDLDAAILSPAGNENSVFTDVGSTALQELDTDFDDEAGIPPAFILLQGLGLQPELAYRLAWFKGEDAGGAWTLRLRDDTVGGTGVLHSWSLTICEPAPPPTCSGTSVTVLSANFESGASGFTHAGTLDEWARGLPTAAPIASCHSGNNCWKTNLAGTYAANSNQDLLSPVLDLTGLAAPIQVSWAQKYQMENASSDSLTVEAREPGPTHERTLFQWLDATMTDTVGSAGTTLQQSAGWGLVRRSLDDYANKPLQLRWNVTSNATGQLAGLAVDDVTVTACCTAASCNDGNACTTDACSAAAGCLHTTLAPAEVSSLTFAANKQTLTWSTPANATRYDLVRGALSALPVGPGGGDEVCFPDLPTATTSDTQTPAARQGFWYLVRGDSTCGPGTYGTATGGAPRATTSCP